MLADIVLAVSDLSAIAVVVGIYFHHHQRRDLLLAYIALNVGILAVTATLSSASVGAGLGLGLFGILSIIRLRSDNITQEEIAYYFVALALGLLAGLDPGPLYVTPLLCGLLVLVVFVADHPKLFPRARRAMLTLDSAIPDEAQLRAHIENRLGVEVRHMVVQEINFVSDLTIVDVRFRAPVGGALRVGTHVPTDQGEPASLSHLHPLATSNGAPQPGTSTSSQSNGVRADQLP
jgi:Domain of unknown function (DUF4956)